jgi:hypothetical protein
MKLRDRKSKPEIFSGGRAAHQSRNIMIFESQGGSYDIHRPDRCWECPATNVAGGTIVVGGDDRIG